MRSDGSATQPEPLLTPAELAGYLGVPIKTLYTWRYRHEGPPALRIGRHLRYRRDDVEDWLHDRLGPALRHLR